MEVALTVSPKILFIAENIPSVAHLMPYSCNFFQLSWPNLLCSKIESLLTVLGLTIASFLGLIPAY